MKKDDNYPSVPYGVFLMCGNDFHGFHVRFNDVARGGIRLVFSRDKPAFSQNEVLYLFPLDLETNYRKEMHFTQNTSIFSGY